MKQRFLSTWLLPCVLIMASPLQAAVETGGAIASGWGTHHITPFRLTLQQSFCDYWNPDPERLWPFKAHIDGNFYYLGSNRHYKQGGSRHVRAFSLGGFLRFSRDPIFIYECAWPYADIGLGAAWLSNSTVAGRHLGMNFQIETKLGVGIRLGEHRQFDIGYRYTNFSNGFLKHPNNTINLHMIVLGYWYP